MKFELNKKDKINKIIERITKLTNPGGSSPSYLVPDYRILDESKLAEFLLEIIESPNDKTD